MKNFPFENTSMYITVRKIVPSQRKQVQIFHLLRGKIIINMYVTNTSKFLLLNYNLRTTFKTTL